MAMHTEVLDEMHQRILKSFQSMKQTNAVLSRLGKAAVMWQQKMAEAAAAQQVFYSIVDEVSSFAHASPAMADLGTGFNNLTDCAKGLSEMQNDIHRTLGDEIIIPLSARIPVDTRNITRMEKDYGKFCSEQADGISRAEKALAKASKRARRNMTDERTVVQMHRAQRALNEQLHELDALRAHTLKRVMTEERTRYAKLMAGMLDVLRVELKQHQRSAPALTAVVQVCTPMCANPGQLPDHFNPLKKRGTTMFMNSVHAAHGSGNSPAYRLLSQHDRNGAHHRSMRHPGGYAASEASHMSEAMSSAASDFGMDGFSPGSGHLGEHQYRTRYPFHGQEIGQLSFAVGHIIECEGESDDNWQFGRNLSTGKEGWFPVNYLERKGPQIHVQDAHVPLPPTDYDNPPRIPDGYDPRGMGMGRPRDPAAVFDGM